MPKYIKDLLMPGHSTGTWSQNLIQ